MKLIDAFLKAIIFTLLMLLVFACKVDAAELKVTMLNVGQGDSFLIETESENILIDTSDAAARDTLINYLVDRQIFTIDRLILTHPHADHIANAAYLINNGFIGAVYDNGKISASQYYKNYLAACNEYNIPRSTLREGDYFFLDDGAYLQILSANRFSQNANNDCIVAKLVYGNFSMLFTGDIEFEVENELFQGDYVLAATVLKAAHHASKTSNSLDFVKAVNPTYIFISAAENNRYGHPHAAALDNFILAGVNKQNIFWTAKNGNVTITTDGSNVTVSPDIVSNWLDNYLGYTLSVQTIWSAD